MDLHSHQMKPFKFLTKTNPIQPPGNMYLMFNMDDALINVIRWRQYHNIEILSDSGTELSMVNVPIVNCWLRIVGWRNYTNTQSPMVEINYSVIEINTIARNFVFRMNETEFIRRIDITRI